MLIVDFNVENICIGQTDRQTDRQTDQQTKDRQTDRQVHKQTDKRQTESMCNLTLGHCADVQIYRDVRMVGLRVAVD